MTSPYRVVIPARFASSRLPGKPLLEIAGIPMIVRVVQQSILSGANQVVVATDDDRVYSVVRAAGHEAIMTSSAHRSGSDRVMEVAETLGWEDESVVVNVQGDEPLIPPAVITQVASIMANDLAKKTVQNISAATLYARIRNSEEIFDSNVVKVVTDRSGRALYFSRAPIPWSRTEFSDPNIPLEDPGLWKRHIGIYAFSVKSLRKFVSSPSSRLEQLESLEQLRLLDQGRDVIAELACEDVPAGVDTPEDLENICKLFP